MNFIFSNREVLNNSKNLLAFSAGIDSSALFFILIENNQIKTLRSFPLGMARLIDKF